MRIIRADVPQSSRITIVEVDASQLAGLAATLAGGDTLDVDVALALAATVAARAVELAVVLGVEVDDVDGAAAVVLDDLVRGVVGAAADDPGLLAGLVSFLRDVVREPSQV